MSLTQSERQILINKINTFTRASLIGVLIPVPNQMSDNEIINFNKFIDYVENKPNDPYELREKRDELIEMMIRHKKIEEDYKHTNLNVVQIY